MGIYIRYGSDLQFADLAEFKEAEDPDDMFSAIYERGLSYSSSKLSVFPRALDGVAPIPLDEDGTYLGLFKTVRAPDGISMSYWGFNAFRNAICKTVFGIEAKELWQLIEDSPEEDWYAQPFVDLINFYDNEGLIAKTAIERLAASFDHARDTVMPSGKTLEDEIIEATEPFGFMSTSQYRQLRDAVRTISKWNNPVICFG